MNGWKIPSLKIAAKPLNENVTRQSQLHFVQNDVLFKDLFGVSNNSPLLHLYDNILQIIVS